MIKYQIYLLKCGRAKYVGSSNQFLKRRLPKHLKDLKENKHVNNFLQSEFNKGHKLEYKILCTKFTFFKEEILRTEQRYINQYANANEAIASKQMNYSKKEFFQDMLDLIVRHWKIVSTLIILILTVVIGLSTEQANEVIKFIVDAYYQFGG